MNTIPFGMWRRLFWYARRCDKEIVTENINKLSIGLSIYFSDNRKLCFTHHDILYKIFLLFFL